jgi:hypothetical protein
LLKLSKHPPPPGCPSLGKGGVSSPRSSSLPRFVQSGSGPKFGRTSASSVPAFAGSIDLG